MFKHRLPRVAPASVQSRQLPRRFRPALEPLEDRVVPAAFVVTSLADSGADSLRAAIEAANALPDADTISFAIPPESFEGFPTITLASQLPTIIHPVEINGYTQSGASGNTLAVGTNASLRIQIDGNHVVMDGLVIAGPNVTVRGLVINGFLNDGIRLDTGATQAT